MLPVSDVLFVEESHKYYKGFTELQGVTTILKEVLFYDKYYGIDEDVLRKAAERGTAIHEAIQAELMHTDCQVDAEYGDDASRALKSWKAFDCGAEITNVFKPIAVEYLVSNEIDIASKIDVVMQSGKEYILADIKTTTSLDEDYLSWQLSIYKYLFELQTGYKVSHLLALWYDRANDSWTAKEVKDKGTDEVLKLIDDWHNGVRRENIVELPAPLLEVGKAYQDIELEIKRIEEKRNEFRSRLMEMMKGYGVKSVKLDGFLATYKEPTERKSFDVKAMLKEHPELKEIVDNYYKTSQVAESIMIKIS